MALQPWTVMLWLSGLLVVIGGLVYLGLSEPGQILSALLFIAIFLVLAYVGYRTGQLIGERRAE